MMRFIKAVCIMLGALILVPIVWFAIIAGLFFWAGDDDEGQGEWQDKGIDGIVSRLDERLDLDENQEDMIRAMLHKKAATLRRYHNNKRDRTIELITADSVTQYDVRAVFDLDDLSDFLQDELTDALVETHGILSQDQRDRLAIMVEQAWPER